jgi:hypothetical protein
MENPLERELINYLYYELNTMGLLLDHEISEYDIQSCIHKYLKSVKRPNEKVEREKENKSDVVIRRQNENNQEIDLIEIKSYIKNNEKLKFSQISSDIKKLSKNIVSYDGNVKARGYFMIVFRERVLHKNYNKTSNKALAELFKNDSFKKHSFEIDGEKIKTRIIRSFKTAYLDKNNDFTIHRNQIRVFMFEILK